MLYADRQTIWGSHDISNADGVPTTPGTVVDGNTTHWSINGQGMENSSVIALLSPPSGPAHLISSVADVGSFIHTNLHQSPASGASPTLGVTASFDFAGSAPLTIAGVSTAGSYSKDGGLTWTLFPTNPAEYIPGNGTVAVAADGSAIYWQFEAIGSQVMISKDLGVTWNVIGDSPSLTSGQIQVLADRKDPSVAYLYDPATGIVYRTDNQGGTLQPVNVLSTGGIMSLPPAAKGDLWFASNGALEHSVDGGATWKETGDVKRAYSVGFGAPKPGTTYPAVYLFGQIGNVTGFYRSTDMGRTFVRINDKRHQYGNAYIVQGDPRVYGRIYIATTGRGIVLGDLKDRSNWR